MRVREMVMVSRGGVVFWLASRWNFGLAQSRLLRASFWIDLLFTGRSIVLMGDKKVSVATVFLDCIFGFSMISMVSLSRHCFLILNV